MCGIDLRTVKEVNDRYEEVHTYRRNLGLSAL